MKIKIKERHLEYSLRDILSAFIEGTYGMPSVVSIEWETYGIVYPDENRFDSDLVGIKDWNDLVDQAFKAIENNDTSTLIWLETEAREKYKLKRMTK